LIKKKKIGNFLGKFFLGIFFWNFFFEIFFEIFWWNFFWIIFHENAERSGATSEYHKFWLAAHHHVANASKIVPEICSGPLINNH
jgi:hypothetical protein